MKFLVLVILFLNLSCFSWAGRIYHSKAEEWNDSSQGVFLGLGCLTDFIITLSLIKPNPLYAFGYFTGLYPACAMENFPPAITVPAYIESDFNKKNREVMAMEDSIGIIQKKEEGYYYYIVQNNYIVQNEIYIYLSYLNNYTPEDKNAVFPSKEKILEDLQKRASNAVTIILTLEKKSDNFTSAVLENLKTKKINEILNRDKKGKMFRNELFEVNVLKTFFPPKISFGYYVSDLVFRSEAIRKDKKLSEVVYSFEMFLNYYHTRDQEIKFKKYIYFEKFHNELIKLDKALRENKKEYLPEIYYLNGMYHLFKGETILAKEYFSKIIPLEIKNDFDRGYVIELINKIDEALATSKLDKEYE